MILTFEEFILEDTSATGGPAGAVTATVGSVGNATVNASTTGMGPVVNAQPSIYPGALSGPDYTNGGGSDGSGDLSATNKNPYFKLKKDKKTKKSKINNLLSIKSATKPDVPKKIMNFEEHSKSELLKVKKIKEV